MPPLYRRLLQDRFDQLPDRVRALHEVHGTSTWSGRADVERGQSRVSRIVATLFALPPAGRDQALTVTFRAQAGREIWERRFGNSVFRSIQYERGGLLAERVGPTTFVFALDASAEGLKLDVRRILVLGLPLPSFFWPAVCTFECERDGRYRFDVEAALPLVGRLVRYSGWLEPHEQGTPAPDAA